MVNGKEYKTSEITVTMDANKTATAYFTDPDAEDTLPPELDNMLIIGGTGVSIDFVRDHRAQAAGRINEALVADAQNLFVNLPAVRDFGFLYPVAVVK